MFFYLQLTANVAPHTLPLRLFDLGPSNVGDNTVDLHIYWATLPRTALLAAVLAVDSTA